MAWLLSSLPLSAAASEAAGTGTPAATTASEEAAPEPKAPKAPEMPSCAEWQQQDAEARSSFLRSRAVTYTEGRQEAEGEVIRACVEGREAVCIDRIDKTCHDEAGAGLEAVVKGCLGDCEINRYGRWYYHTVMNRKAESQAPKKKAN
jgi:hypothetical protein